MHLVISEDVELKETSITLMEGRKIISKSTHRKTHITGLTTAKGITGEKIIITLDSTERGGASEHA